MRVTYLKLVNVAGLYIGSQINELEIDLSKSTNTVIGIIAPNGGGKTSLLSSISPFAYVTSIDERSSLSYIIPGCNGYKEIRYLDGDCEYTIKHYYTYKNTDKSFTVKSYFAINGTEMNENGNVRSFLTLVEVHMGLTQDMMRLIRLGSNVNSIISLTSSSRKEYVGKLISEIDIYLQIYKDINDELRVVKSLISSNDASLYNCHISDILIEEDSLRQLASEIKALEKSRDKLIAELANIKTLMKSNNIDELKRKKHEAEASLHELDTISIDVDNNHLRGVSVDSLITKRSDTVSKKIDTQSKINSYRMSIDGSLKIIERIETSVKKVTSNNDVRSLTSAIESLRKSISDTNPIITSFKAPSDITSDTLSGLINRLASFNVIGQTIRTFGDKPFEVYMKLVSEHKSIDKWLKDQARKARSGIRESDIKAMYDLVFKDGSIITPNCENEFTECPYYRFSEMLDSVQHELNESFDPETLRYIQVISNNIDMMLNELDTFRKLRLPDRLRGFLKEQMMLERFHSKLPFFDIGAFQEYLTIVRASEIYNQELSRLAQFEYQLSIYKNSGIDSQLDEISQLKDNIAFYRNNISVLEGQISAINAELSTIDSQISLVSRFSEMSKYKKMFESTLSSTTKILDPLEKAEQEKVRVEMELSQALAQIENLRERYSSLERRIAEYNRLVEEGHKLSIKSKHLNAILKSTNTKQGIPMRYMKRYLWKIKSLANNLLSIIYGDSFKLANFKITHDTFDIPYVKNGRKIADIRYASQSELAMSTIALSFALSNRSSTSYNIPLLDEVESGLDESNRISFLKMFDMQMHAINAEQAFFISQNINQMANIPMDIICLGDTVIPKSKLQNIIYQRKD